MNHYFDNIYLINLDSRTDRLKTAHNNLSNLNIEYERVAAAQIPFEKINPALYSDFEQHDPNYVAGSYGCKVSHLKVIADALQKQYKNILILEDDISINPDYKNILDSAIQQLETYNLQWDMLYLGGHYRWGGFYTDGSRWFQEYVGEHVLKIKGAMTTLAYALSDRIYDFILKNAVKENCEIDIFYYKMHQHAKQFSYFGIIPPAVEELKSESNIKTP